MVKHSFVFLTLFLIGIIDMFSLDFAVSVIPGWHTPIYPPWFIINLVALTWLGCSTLIYVVIEKMQTSVSKRYFLIHWICSLSFFVLAIEPIPAIVIFLFGQLVFVIAATVAVIDAKKQRRL